MPLPENKINIRIYIIMSHYNIFPANLTKYSCFGFFNRRLNQRVGKHCYRFLMTQHYLLQKRARVWVSPVGREARLPGAVQGGTRDNVTRWQSAGFINTQTLGEHQNLGRGWTASSLGLLLLLTYSALPLNSWSLWSLTSVIYFSVTPCRLW